LFVPKRFFRFRKVGEAFTSPPSHWFVGVESQTNQRRSQSDEDCECGGSTDTPTDTLHKEVQAAGACSSAVS